MPDVAGFWSYAHADNSADKGRILALADDIRDEYSLLAGTELTLFVDRDGIEWGDEWKHQIDGALSTSTLFFPVLTPRYFARAECRRELQAFIGEARSYGLTELVLPILYIPISGLQAEASDDLMARLSAIQHEDWTARRVLDRESEQYRQGVASLALRIVNLVKHMAGRSARPAADESDDVGDLGLADLVDRINSRLPTWHELIENDRTRQAQIMAIQLAHEERRMRSPGSRAFALEQRLANQLLPLTSVGYEDVKSFLAATLELDPLVLAAIRLVDAHPEDRGMLSKLEEALHLFERQMSEMQVDEDMTRRGLAERYAEWANARRHTSRVMAQLANVCTAHDATVHDANVRVQEWSRRLADARRRSNRRD